MPTKNICIADVIYIVDDDRVSQPFTSGNAAIAKSRIGIKIKNPTADFEVNGTVSSTYDFSGEGAPNPSDGAVGSVYHRTDVNDDGYLYLKTPDGWQSIEGIAGPIGPQGPVGPQGPAGADGSAGTVGPQGPQGDTGATGPKGDTGAKGDTGNTGPAGTAATVSVGSTTTGAAGSSAAVTNSGTSSAAVFNFTIPKGDTGAGGALGYWGSFWSTATQTNVASTNAMTLNSSDPSNSGISIVSSSRLTFAYQGVYNIQFSAVFSKTSSNSTDVNVWIAKNGSNVADTNTILTVGGQENSVAAWNFMLALNAGDYIQFYWHSNNANVQIVAQAAQTGPTIPATPSIILTAQQVMYTQINEPREVLSDTVSYTNYIGHAPSGSATSASVWIIHRTIYTSAGVISSTAVATNVKWTDRLTATYV